MSKETPCVAVCMIDPRTKLCFGCGRTLPEIARWHAMESAERLTLMTLLPARMADERTPWSLYRLGVAAYGRPKCVFFDRRRPRSA